MIVREIYEKIIPEIEKVPSRFFRNFILTVW